EYEETLPPVPASVRLAPTPGSPAEVAEEVGVLLAAVDDVTAFERTLDGLVRGAHSDPDALREALEPVVGRRPWYASGNVNVHYFHHHRHIETVLAALLNKGAPGSSSDPLSDA